MAYPGYPPLGQLSPPSAPSRQNKVVLQRQYREKEGECFSTLRDIIKELTDEELQTRQEILKKAIDLLSKDLESRRQRAAGVDPPASYGVTPFTNHPADAMATQAHIGYFPQPPYPPQTWPANAESGAGSAHHTGYSHNYQYGVMDAAAARAGYQYYGQRPM